METFIQCLKSWLSCISECILDIFYVLWSRKSLEDGKNERRVKRRIYNSLVNYLAKNRMDTKQTLLLEAQYASQVLAKKENGSFENTSVYGMDRKTTGGKDFLTSECKALQTPEASMATSCFIVCTGSSDAMSPTIIFITLGFRRTQQRELSDGIYLQIFEVNKKSRHTLSCSCGSKADILSHLVQHLPFDNRYERHSSNKANEKSAHYISKHAAWLYRDSKTVFEWKIIFDAFNIYKSVFAHGNTIACYHANSNNIHIPVAYHASSRMGLVKSLNVIINSSSNFDFSMNVKSMLLEHMIVLGKILSQSQWNICFSRNVSYADNELRYVKYQEVRLNVKEKRSTEAFRLAPIITERIVRTELDILVGMSAFERRNVAATAHSHFVGKESNFDELSLTPFKNLENVLNAAKMKGKRSVKVKHCSGKQHASLDSASNEASAEFAKPMKRNDVNVFYKKEIKKQVVFKNVATLERSSLRLESSLNRAESSKRGEMHDDKLQKLDFKSSELESKSRNVHCVPSPSAELCSLNVWKKNDFSGVSSSSVSLQDHGSSFISEKGTSARATLATITTECVGTNCMQQQGEKHQPSRSSNSSRATENSMIPRCSRANQVPFVSENNLLLSSDSFTNSEQACLNDGFDFKNYFLPTDCNSKGHLFNADTIFSSDDDHKCKHGIQKIGIHTADNFSDIGNNILAAFDLQKGKTTAKTMAPFLREMSHQNEDKTTASPFADDKEQNTKSRENYCNFVSTHRLLMKPGKNCAAVECSKSLNQRNFHFSGAEKFVVGKGKSEFVNKEDVQQEISQCGDNYENVPTVIEASTEDLTWQKVKTVKCCPIGRWFRKKLCSFRSAFRCSRVGRMQTRFEIGRTEHNNSASEEIKGSAEKLI